MTALLREPLKVYMPAAAVSHVRLIPRWGPFASGVLRFAPPLCHTRLPAFVCACGERRLLLEWPDGRREWQMEDGRYVLQTPRYQVEYSEQDRRRRLLFLSADASAPTVWAGPPPEPDHWTAVRNFYFREPATFERPQVEPASDAFLLGGLINFCLREAGLPGSVTVEPLQDGQMAVADEHGLRAMVEADTVEALVDYAREGNERDFRDLAAMSGVPLAQLDELWQGTCARLGGAR